MDLSPKFAAVLFDCDGVLVDSESITNGVLRTMLAELGWNLSPEEAVTRFVGKMLRDEADVIEEHTGYRIDADWLTEFRRRRNVELDARLEAIPGVVEAVRLLEPVYPGKLACASSADRPKIELQLKKIGLYDAFEGRIFSGMELPGRSRPPTSTSPPRMLSMSIPPRRPSSKTPRPESSRGGLRDRTSSGSARRRRCIRRRRSCSPPVPMRPSTRCPSCRDCSCAKGECAGDSVHE